MELLKRLFGSTSAGGSAGDPNGIYFYVQPDGCEEVVRVRIDRNNDLSLADDGSGYLVRKSVRGSKCRQSAELYVEFDSSRKVSHTEVQGGALVDSAAYEAWMAKEQR